MAVNEFDTIAPVYDALVKLVFGKKISSVQNQHLSFIQESHQVLILGGGTGKLLDDIPICNHIDFLDKSSRMIGLAQKRKSRNNVQFITADFLQYETPKTYDVIICPFFLDCFNKENLINLIEKIKRLLNEEGVAIVSDFQRVSDNGILLKFMHWFFRMTTSLESKELLEIRRKLTQSGFKELDLKSGLNGLFSGLYKLERGN